METLQKNRLTFFNRNQPAQNNPGSIEKQILDRLINNNQQYDTLVRPTVKNTSGKGNSRNNYYDKLELSSLDFILLL